MVYVHRLEHEHLADTDGAGTQMGGGGGRMGGGTETTMFSADGVRLYQECA